jgi:hypothetical protein
MIAEVPATDEAHLRDGIGRTSSSRRYASIAFVIGAPLLFRAP